MEWTDISITVAKRDADTAEAIATMVANGGIYIEDYSDLEQQAWEIAHVDLIEQELLDKPRDVVIVHMYLAPDENPAEVLPLFEERLQNSGINYQLNTTGVEQEDWQNGWKKYYHAMDIGDRLAIVPGWEDHQTDRIKIIMDPGMAFGTGTHETTSLCLETLDSLVKGGERVLDIGTGSGILAIAALKLGAAEAEGVDKADLPQIMQNNLQELNAQLAAYERISGIALYPNEFEKTPKRSIKRYLYEPSLLNK